jgi:hypothetical protein
MAEAAATALRGPDAPRRLLVVAGELHVRRFAVPERAARRGATPYLIVLPVSEEEADPAVRAGVADLLWVLWGT